MKLSGVSSGYGDGPVRSSGSTRSLGLVRVGTRVYMKRVFTIAHWYRNRYLTKHLVLQMILLY